MPTRIATHMLVQMGGIDMDESTRVAQRAPLSSKRGATHDFWQPIMELQVVTFERLLSQLRVRGVHLVCVGGIGDRAIKEI